MVQTCSGDASEMKQRVSVFQAKKKQLFNYEGTISGIRNRFFSIRTSVPMQNIECELRCVMHLRFSCEGLRRCIVGERCVTAHPHRNKNRNSAKIQDFDQHEIQKQ